MYIINYILCGIVIYYLYDFLYPHLGYQNLNDFFVGASVYENHNKFLDIGIFCVFIAVFFIFLPLSSYLYKKIKPILFIINVELHKHKFTIKKPLNDETGKFFLSSNISMALQILCSFGYLLLNPLDGHFYPKVFFISVLLVLFCIYDILISNKKQNNKISTLAIGGLLTAFFGSSYAVQNYLIDDHHIGEKLATYAAHRDFNMTYYKDIMLVHGYIDISGAWLGEHLFNKKDIYGYLLGEAFLGNMVFLFNYFIANIIFRKRIFVFLMLIISGFSTQLISLLILSYLLLIKKINRPFTAIIIFILMSTFFIHLWTSYGLFWTFSALPVFVFLFFKLLKNSVSYKTKIFQAASILLLIAVITYIKMPEILLFINKAKFYVDGNLPAFGTAFPEILNLKDIINPIIKLFALWILPVIAIVFFKDIKSHKKNKKIIFVYSFILLLPITSLTYSLGRIDSFNFTRISYLSYSYLLIILPWILIQNQSKLLPRIEKIVYGCLILFIIFHFDVMKSKFVFYNQNIAENRFITQRVENLKKSVGSFDSKLVYLDLTNRGMNYYYLKKKPPIPYLSFYNCISSAQTEDITPNTDIELPDIILVSSKNLQHDKIFASLRINSLYRKILLSRNYKFFEENNNQFLIKTVSKTDLSKKDLYMLDKSMGAADIEHLPQAWGESLKFLPLEIMNINYKIKTIKRGNVVQMNVMFDKAYAGKDIELMLLDYSTKKSNGDYKIEIEGSNTVLKFTDVNASKLLIPLDNFPSWLLCKNTKEIKITAYSTENTVPKIKFYKRNNKRNK